MTVCEMLNKFECIFRGLKEIYELVDEMAYHGRVLDDVNSKDIFNLINRLSKVQLCLEMANDYTERAREALVVQEDN